MFHKKHSLVKQKLSHSEKKTEKSYIGPTVGEDSHSWGPWPRGMGQPCRMGQRSCTAVRTMGWRTGRREYKTCCGQHLLTGWSRQAVGNTREAQGPTPPDVGFIILCKLPTAPVFQSWGQQSVRDDASHAADHQIGSESSGLRCVTFWWPPCQAPAWHWDPPRTTACSRVPCTGGPGRREQSWKGSQFCSTSHSTCILSEEGHLCTSS